MSEPTNPFSGFRIVLMASAVFIAIQMVKIRDRIELGFRDVLIVLKDIRGPLK